MKSRRNRLAMALLISSMLTMTQVKAMDWSIGPSMATPRSEFHVAQTQGKLYVAGGITKFRTSSRCEVFDIKTSSWSACPRLPEALHHVSLATVNDVVFAGGGYTNLLFNFLASPPLWRLDLEAGKWEQAGQLPFAVGEHALIGLGPDLYLVGGRTKSGTSSELWRLRNSVWQPLADMNIARDSFAAVQSGTDLWVIGGRNNQDGALNSVEIYDTLSNKWSMLPALPYRAGGLAAVNIAGEVHVLGGESLTDGVVYDRHLRFDKASKTWVEEAPISQPRHGSAAIALDRKAYLLGGGSRAGWRTIYSVTDTVQVLTK